MSRITYTALNTMSQLQKQLDIISNNVANVDTTGYKKQRASFQELLIQQHNNHPVGDRSPRLTPEGVRIGTGGKVSQIQTIATQGSLKDTGRSLDFALTVPNQYFKVLAPNGNELNIHYTRDGAFYLSPMNDSEVALVTSEGHYVLDQDNNPIIFNGDLKKVALGDDGMVTFSNETGDSESIALGIVQINNPQALVKTGNNLLTIPDHFQNDDITADDLIVPLVGAARDQIGLQHQALEQSNVDLIEEMTNLIQTQRAYQLQARAITLADQMSGLVNGIR
ncbi:flagellar hook-basal body protein [Pallidibacillus thermolactis]|uniref:flagellar hook-basal body protein n=1 Tax=Pallidibacillus thermolactis TaxID=251051 RepID=UPI0021D8F0BE|nr:flagellar hook-basal body protein [Pallidibacillus thermolactis]MCU9599754.1 flagellar hook-basal body protein [Pallidibacillus thermolactis subsp. kokeshiiformis]